MNALLPPPASPQGPWEASHAPAGASDPRQSRLHSSGSMSEGHTQQGGQRARPAGGPPGSQEVGLARGLFNWGVYPSTKGPDVGVAKPNLVPVVASSPRSLHVCRAESQAGEAKPFPKRLIPTFRLRFSVSGWEAAVVSQKENPKEGCVAAAFGGSVGCLPSAGGQGGRDGPARGKASPCRPLRVNVHRSQWASASASRGHVEHLLCPRDLATEGTWHRGKVAAGGAQVPSFPCSRGRKWQRLPGFPGRRPVALPAPQPP